MERNLGGEKRKKKTTSGFKENSRLDWHMCTYCSCVCRSIAPYSIVGLLCLV